MNKQQKNAIFRRVYEAVFDYEYAQIDGFGMNLEIKQARRNGFPEEELHEAIQRAKASAQQMREQGFLS